MMPDALFAALLVIGGLVLIEQALGALGDAAREWGWPRVLLALLAAGAYLYATWWWWDKAVLWLYPPKIVLNYDDHAGERFGAMLFGLPLVLAAQTWLLAFPAIGLFMLWRRRLV
jgi:hypothetical protein